MQLDAKQVINVDLYQLHLIDTYYNPGHSKTMVNHARAERVTTKICIAFGVPVHMPFQKFSLLRPEPSELLIRLKEFTRGPSTHIRAFSRDLHHI